MVPLKDVNPTYKKPIVNYALIIINVAVFLYEITLSHSDVYRFFMEYSFIPSVFWRDPAGNWYRIFTSMFIHGGWGHILGNMLYLWVFGDNVEDKFGHLGYFLFYIASGVGGALLHGIFSFGSAVPTVGASGAISGVLGAYVVFFPGAWILTFIPPFFLIPLPALLFIGVWIMYQVSYGFISVLVPTGVAWFAHIGGFGTGYLLAKRKKTADAKKRAVDVEYWRDL